MYYPRGVFNSWRDRAEFSSRKLQMRKSSTIDVKILIYCIDTFPRKMPIGIGLNCFISRNSVVTNTVNVFLSCSLLKSVTLLDNKVKLISFKLQATRELKNFNISNSVTKERRKVI